VDVDDVDNRPSFFESSGAACCAMKSGARRFDPMSSSQCEGSMAPTATGKKLDALFTRRSSRPKASSAATTSARGATGASSSAFTFAALFARVALSSDARRAASASESR
jgi:hypothetical protein